MRFAILGALLAVLIVVILWQRRASLEGFTGEPDRFSETEAKLHEKVFENEALYQFDVEAIKKIMVGKGAGKDKGEGLDAGTGTGQHYQQLAKHFKKVVGVDRSPNMLKRARLRNSSGEFLEGDLRKRDLFPQGRFDFIVATLDTLYYDADNTAMLENFWYWLKPNGYLFVHLFNDTPTDPAPQPHSQYYDAKDGKHSLTYYPGFAHDAHWEVRSSESERRGAVAGGDSGRTVYVQAYITENGEKTEKRLTLYIPNKPAMIKRIEGLGFKLVDVVSMKPLSIVDFELFAFQKSGE